MAKLLEERIALESDPDRLQALYEEQADQFLAMDDFDGAIGALDQLIGLAPAAISAYVTKIEILATMDRWNEVIGTIRRFIEGTDDAVEARNMSWRAADIIADQIGDVGAALPWLEQLVASGDQHPDTERRMAALAERAENWELALASLGRLEALLDSESERVELKVKQATIRLERLFDLSADFRLGIH